MMPNIDPSQLKKMMERMGIKSSEIDAKRVIIESAEGDIIIDEPQVMLIEAQGTKSFQITGSVTERRSSEAKVEISEDDIKIVKEQSGVSDDKLVREALEESNGNIAEAILKLKEG
ncbi:MAG: nascent polypeptide-associated complex protein [Candidatus Micrarchaeaceae archaeon]